MAAIQIDGDITSIVIEKDEEGKEEINGGGFGISVKGNITSNKNAIQVGQE